LKGLPVEERTKGREKGREKEGGEREADELCFCFIYRYR
jgi:hypothetical protein